MNASAKSPASAAPRPVFAVDPDALRQKLIDTNGAMISGFERLLGNLEASLAEDHPVPVLDILRVMQEELRAFVTQVEGWQANL